VKGEEGGGEEEEEGKDIHSQQKVLLPKQQKFA
jgi:hypothetical protein